MKTKIWFTIAKWHLSPSNNKKILHKKETFPLPRTRNYRHCYPSPSIQRRLRFSEKWLHCNIQQTNLELLLIILFVLCEGTRQKRNKTQTNYVQVRLCKWTTDRDSVYVTVDEPDNKISTIYLSDILFKHKVGMMSGLEQVQVDHLSSSRSTFPVVRFKYKVSDLFQLENYIQFCQQKCQANGNKSIPLNLIIFSICILKRGLFLITDLVHMHYLRSNAL